MQNLLLKGDALSLLPTLEAGSFDALITHPPYASGGVNAAARQKPPSAKYPQGGRPVLHADFLGDERDQRSHLQWMTMWLSECARVLKDGAPVCVFTDWRQLPLTTDALQCAGFTWRGVTVWDKAEGVRPQRGRFRNQAEYIVWGSKGAMPLDRNAAAGRHQGDGAPRRQAAHDRQADRSDALSRADLRGGQADPGSVRWLGHDAGGRTDGRVRLDQL